MNMHVKATKPLSDMAELAKAFDEACRVFRETSFGVTYLRDHDSLQVPHMRGVDNNCIVLHVEGTTARMGNFDSAGNFKWLIEDNKGHISIEEGQTLESARRFLLDNFRL